MRCTSLVAVCLPGVLAMAMAAGAVGAAEDEGELKLLLHLTDGSRLIGLPVSPEAAKIRTDLATFSVSWQKVDHVHRAENGPGWVFELKNGDRIKGDPGFTQVEIEALFGRVAIGTEHIAEIVVAELGVMPEEGLVLHYRFDQRRDQETVPDLSGEENHAINRGGTIVPKGVVGSALSLDGKSALLEVDGGEIAGLPAWDDYTISVWFLNDGGGDKKRGYGQKIIDKTVMHHDFYLCVRATGALGFFTYEGEGVGLQDDSHDYRDGKWHHAVVVKKGGHGELWVDGKLKASSGALKKVKTTAPLLIGYSKSSDGFQRKYWSGLLDELRIYKRALSRREVANLSRGGRF